MKDRIPKTTRELRKLGVTNRFVDFLVTFQKENQLKRIEMLEILQDCQLFLIENLICEMKEDEK